jgi:hypothetical protein
MKCALCEKFGNAGLVLQNGNGVCFYCLMELKKFQHYAPNPY